MKKTDIRIAAQLYTVRAFIKTEDDIAATLKKLKGIGYDCVQASALGPHRTEFLRDALKENGMTVCATHMPYDRIVNDTEAVVREHKMLECKFVGLGHMPLKTLDDVKTKLSELLPAARKLHDSGLQFVYHNHQHEFLRIDGGKRIMDCLLAETKSEEFGLLPDLYWLQAAGADPAKFVTENAERIDVVHLKDMCVGPDLGQRYAEIFEGNMNYADLLPSLERAGVSYAAVEQDDCYGKDPFECLRISRENIRKHWGI